MLLGAKLTHLTPNGHISGIIVETEAYTQDDPASHTFRGKTLRNAAMFDGPGTIYIYFTYGMHYCLNFVCGPVGKGEAVLIRALQPLEGIHQMEHNRKKQTIEELANGPAKLVQALGVTKDSNGIHLNNSNFRLELPKHSTRVVQTTRIGIRSGVELPRRFYIEGNRFISRP